MSNIRTANRRHKRAIVTTHARNKAAEQAMTAPVQPAPTAPQS